MRPARSLQFKCQLVAVTIYIGGIAHNSEESHISLGRMQIMRRRPDCVSNQATHHSTRGKQSLVYIKYRALE